MASCQNCGNPSLDNAEHVRGQRTCCPDCDHRLRCVEVNGARVQVDGAVPEPLVRALAALADAVQRAFDTSRPRDCVCDSVGADKREHVDGWCIPRYITGA